MKTTDAEHTESVLREVAAERVRQDAKWGQQNHPSVDQTLARRRGGCTQERMCEEYEIPSEDRAKQKCENATANGTVTYAHIAVEEMSEAVSAKYDTARRVELVQLAAVVVGWIEAIDRRVGR
jgi:hypothetical protein